MAAYVSARNPEQLLMDSSPALNLASLVRAPVNSSINSSNEKLDRFVTTYMEKEAEELSKL